MKKVLTLAFLLILLCLFGCKNRETLTIGVYAGTYWNTPNGDSYQILDYAIEQFQKRHPDVSVEYVSGITTDGYSEWLAEKILLGKEPDLYFVLPEDFNLLVYSGALAKLDERMAADPDFDPGWYYAPCFQSGSFQGSQYALPYESVPTIMFVNKTLLAEHGIPMPDNEWTWDDFYSICRQITDVERRQFGVYNYAWLDALYSNGTSLFSESGRSCFLADARVQKAIQFTQELSALNEGYTVSARDFDMGYVAFRPFLLSEYRAYQPYPWRVKKYSSFEWDCVCMPAGPEGGNVSELHTMLLGISSRSGKQELAWEFAKMLSADESIQKQLYTYSHGISPLTAIAEDRGILEQLQEDIPGGSGFAPDMIHNIMSSAMVVPRFDHYDQALIMAESAVTEVIAEGKELQSGLLTAQREINIFLNK